MDSNKQAVIVVGMILSAILLVAGEAFLYNYGITRQAFEHGLCSQQQQVGIGRFEFLPCERLKK